MLLLSQVESVVQQHHKHFLQACAGVEALEDQVGTVAWQWGMGNEETAHWKTYRWGGGVNTVTLVEKGVTGTRLRRMGYTKIKLTSWSMLGDASQCRPPMLRTNTCGT
jgi:hypothetical protein